MVTRPAHHLLAPMAHQLGETLAGLLVGMAVGLFALAGGAHFMGHLLRSHLAVLQGTQLQQDMHFAIDRMADALQNAQYTATASRTRAPGVCDDVWCQHTHFQSLDNSLTWAADSNHNGALDNNECMGFRVRDGVLSMRVGCHTGGWQPMTDVASVVVTRLHAQPQCQASAYGLRRQVHLRLEAHAPGIANAAANGAASPSASQWQRTVSVRNDLPHSVQAVFCP